MKIFTSDSVALVPPEWARALGSSTSHHQAHIVAVAKDKATLQCMFTTATNPGSAYHLIRAVKLTRDPDLSTTERALFDAKIINRELSGIFVYIHPVKDAPIIQVLSQGLPVVGHFRLSGGYPGTIYAEKA